METKPEGISMEQVLALISTLNQQQQENLKNFAAELRKPTDREAAKMAQEDARIAKAQAERQEMWKAEEQRKEMQKRNCSHTDERGKHLWRAQVHAPHGQKPYFVPTCSACFTQLPKILASSEMLTQGVNLDKYRDIDMGALERWAATTVEAVA